MTATSTSSQGTFVTVPGDRHSGIARTLAVGLTAIVLGTVLGTLPVALAGLPGTRTGAPARALRGTRAADQRVTAA